MNQTEALSAEILDIVATKCDVSEEIHTDTRFEDLDLDSLVLIELSVQLTKKFGVEVTDDELFTAGSVARIAELLAAKGVRS
ncbi:acyl carrier protein [Thermobifida halotolerans]|uniref:Acyl carrier protein n=1 Tax=Thermobifida halotolerans TaxID=483545 RepID=A0A399FVR5_9ACTN|nr:acyl carrier protein [Thermobifida halotolerans]UOE19021.1 acyl carrier protein [Thermobifida halotolerans]